MPDITKLDKNFIIESNIERENIKFFNPEEAPFKIYGVFRDGSNLCRMPQTVADNTNETVKGLNRACAGGRIRFITDSDYVAVVIKTDWICKIPSISVMGSGGCDIYVGAAGNQVHYGNFSPKMDSETGYSAVVDLWSRGLKEIQINLPLYSNIQEIYLGLRADAVIKEPKPYKYEKPIVFYGSSITQGASASRPGTSYEAIVSRYFDTNIVNLGFSGGAMGEDAVIDHIASLDMSAFVYDYDFNAPNAEHLAATHEKGFKKIRAAHPNIPILIMSKPNNRIVGNDIKRRDIIYNTYKNAVSGGDSNVAFLDGKDLIEPFLSGSSHTDLCHPNDSGFASMAKAVIKVFEKFGYEKV